MGSYIKHLHTVLKERNESYERQLREYGDENAKNISELEEIKKP